MNIFFLDASPEKSAEFLCDKHVPKMLLESCQMLSTIAHNFKYDGVKDLYKPTHQNHPMTKWVGLTKNNYMWTCEHGLALSKEYTKRYDKVHKSHSLVKQLYDLCNSFFTFHGGDPSSIFITPPPQCMPDKYKDDDYVIAYRRYYINDKKYFAKWEKGRKQPKWWVN